VSMLASGPTRPAGGRLCPSQEQPRYVLSVHPSAQVCSVGDRTCYRQNEELPREPASQIRRAGTPTLDSRVHG
jgi:hypothetical protein